MSDYSSSHKSIKDKINGISPSFCAAKWTQVTMHLHNGRTHSCHHPRTHVIPLNELKRNPTALHNTQYKKQQRKLMMEGKRPAECQYCWNVEDLPNYDKETFFSDRVIKSAADWSVDKIDEIKNAPWDQDGNPTYVEVSFSNICNFKCSYCSPVYSSRWTEEVKKHGPYPTSQKFNNLEYYERVEEMPIHHTEHNPYVEAFWKWWPELVTNLKVFRITGGEPLLCKDTFKVLDYLNMHPQPQLELAINTNGCPPGFKLEEFVMKAQELLNAKKIKNLSVFMSIDGSGRAAEYGRHGLDYTMWLVNLEAILRDLPTAKVTIMSTTNIFSITSYQRLLEHLLSLRKRYTTMERPVPISLDIAILRHPHHQCVSILTPEYKNTMDPALEFMKEHMQTDSSPGFLDYEVARMERFIEFLKAKPNEKERLDIYTARQDFYKFVTEHDKRRGTDFLKVFPELEQFYNNCKGLIDG